MQAIWKIWIFWFSKNFIKLWYEGDNNMIWDCVKKNLKKLTKFKPRRKNISSTSMEIGNINGKQQQGMRIILWIKLYYQMIAKKMRLMITVFCFFFAVCSPVAVRETFWPRFVYRFYKLRGATSHIQSTKNTTKQKSSQRWWNFHHNPCKTTIQFHRMISKYLRESWNLECQSFKLHSS